MTVVTVIPNLVIRIVGTDIGHHLGMAQCCMRSAWGGNLQPTVSLQSKSK